MDWTTIDEGDSNRVPNVPLESGRWYRLVLSIAAPSRSADAVRATIWASLAPFLDLREVTVNGNEIIVAWVW